MWCDPANDRATWLELAHVEFERAVLAAYTGVS